METKEQKSCSLQGRVNPISWGNPNSSSAFCNNLWNMGFPKNVIGTMYLVLFSPTYTAKCPFGTSFLLPELEHLRVTAFAVVEELFLFVFHIAMAFLSFLFGLSLLEIIRWWGKNEGGYRYIYNGKMRKFGRNKNMWSVGAKN